MKAKKWLIIITGIISVVSVACAWLCRNMQDDFFVNFFFAIMGSAILGGIMSLTEYFVARKQCLERYYLAAYDILRQIRKVIYVFTDEPIELIKQYFLELQSNKWNSILGKKESTQAKDALFSYLVNRWKRIVDIPEPEFTDYAEERFRNKMEKYFEDINDAMKSYVRISEIDLMPLENAYGELDFVFANNSVRKQIFEQIHLELREYLHSVARQAYHFRLFLSGEADNLAVMLGKIDELQQEYFSIDENCEGSDSVITVYNKFAYSMDENIEKLRCRIYGQKYVRPENTPVMVQRIRRSIGFPVIGEKNFDQK